jgi:hypothetical protein
LIHLILISGTTAKKICGIVLQVATTIAHQINANIKQVATISVISWGL